MKKEFYKNLSVFMGSHSRLSRAAVVLTKGITYTIYLFFPLFLGLLCFQKSEFLMRAILVPAVSFFVLSVVRRLINAPRPYEKWDIPPLYSKDKKGCSFPSRHTFSAFIIALTVLFVSPPLGCALLFLSTALAILRVICGVHFIKDVLAGAVFALISALIGYILI